MNQINKIMVCSLFCAVIFCSTSVRSHAKGLSAKLSEHDASFSTLLWRTPIYVAMNQYLSVALHEYGHAAVVTLIGEKVKEINISFKGGYVTFEGNPTSGQQVIILLAGPFANRFTATGINYYLDRNEYQIDESMRSFLGTAYIWNRLSFAWYLIMPSVNYVLFGRDYNSDWSGVASIISNNDPAGTDILMGAFIALELLDIYLTRDEISRNFDRMLGRYSPIENNKTGFYTLPFDISSYGKGFIISKSVHF